MRVELVYHPECNLYKSIYKVLEDVIAEERLPIPVEMVEEKARANAPYIRLDGHIIMNIKNDHTFEHLRDFVRREWIDINHPKETNPMA